MAARGRQMTLSLPPFTPAVTWLLGINVGVYVAMLLASMVVPDAFAWTWAWFGLTPFLVMHGYVWQIVTYAFIHEGFMHLFVNMFGLWMFGATIENAWGTRRFVELYTVGFLGAALTSIAISYTHVLGSPRTTTGGASGAVMAILMVFGMIFGDNEIMLIPFPFLIRAKYFIGILIVVTVIFAMQDRGGVAYVAHLGGLLFGYLYAKFVPRGGFHFVFSERFYGIRNGYYRWKRRKAAKKFEVYMRKHAPEDSFYVPGDQKNSSSRDKHDPNTRGPWVN